MKQEANLFCCEGNSDKVYHVFLEEQGSGYVVNFAYGRRGSALKTGTKTNTPVDFAKAEKIFENLVNQKISGGYKPIDGESIAGVHVTEKVDTGMRPQLSNSVEESEALRLLGDDNYILQEKKDGERMMLKQLDSKLTVANRKGQAVGHSKALDVFLEIDEDFILDGEIIGDVLHAFDILTDLGVSLVNGQFKNRLASLEAFASRNENLACLKIVRSAIGTPAKKALFEQLKNENAEGVIFKRADSTYAPGRPNSGGTHLKFKFVETASFIVESVNAQRSIRLSLLDEHKNKVDAGNVTIPANHQIPKPGEVVEVRYLYAYKESGSVYQPVFLGKRNDIEADECLTSQLKYKSAA